MRERLQQTRARVQPGVSLFSRGSFGLFFFLKKKKKKKLIEFHEFECVRCFYVLISADRVSGPSPSVAEFGKIPCLEKRPVRRLLPGSSAGTMLPCRQLGSASAPHVRILPKPIKENKRCDTFFFFLIFFPPACSRSPPFRLRGGPGAGGGAAGWRVLGSAAAEGNPPLVPQQEHFSLFKQYPLLLPSVEERRS